MPVNARTLPHIFEKIVAFLYVHRVISRHLQTHCLRTLVWLYFCQDIKRILGKFGHVLNMKNVSHSMGFCSICGGEINSSNVIA